MSHTFQQRSHVTHMNESCHTFEWHRRKPRQPRCVPPSWLDTLGVHRRYMTHVLICVTWFMCWYVWHDSCVHMCDMTHVMMCVTWLMCWCVLHDSCAWQVVLKCVAVCCSVLQCVAVCCSVLQCVAVCCSVLGDDDDECVWMSHVARVNESCHAYEWFMSHMWMSYVTHVNESCRTYQVVFMKMTTSVHEWVMSHV